MALASRSWSSSAMIEHRVAVLHGEASLHDEACSLDECADRTSLPTSFGPPVDLRSRLSRRAHHHLSAHFRVRHRRGILPCLRRGRPDEGSEAHAAQQGARRLEHAAGDGQRLVGDDWKQCSRRARGSTSPSLKPALTSSARAEQAAQHAVEARADRQVVARDRRPRPRLTRSPISRAPRKTPGAGSAQHSLLGEAADLPGDAGVGQRLPFEDDPAQRVTALGLDHGVHVAAGDEPRPQSDHRRGVVDTRAQVALRHDGVDEQSGPELDAARAASGSTTTGPLRGPAGRRSDRPPRPSLPPPLRPPSRPSYTASAKATVRRTTVGRAISVMTTANPERRRRSATPVARSPAPLMSAMGRPAGVDAADRCRSPRRLVVFNRVDVLADAAGRPPATRQISLGMPLDDLAAADVAALLEDLREQLRAHQHRVGRPAADQGPDDRLPVSANRSIRRSSSAEVDERLVAEQEDRRVAGRAGRPHPGLERSAQSLPRSAS